MRYMMLLVALLIFAELVTFMFTNSANIFSPNAQVKLEDIKPQVEKVEKQMEEYNDIVKDSVKEVEGNLIDK